MIHVRRNYIYVLLAFVLAFPLYLIHIFIYFHLYLYCYVSRGVCHVGKWRWPCREVQHIWLWYMYAAIVFIFYLYLYGYFHCILIHIFIHFHLCLYCFVSRGVWHVGKWRWLCREFWAHLTHFDTLWHTCTLTRLNASSHSMREFPNCISNLLPFFTL